MQKSILSEPPCKSEAWDSSFINVHLNLDVPNVSLYGGSQFTTSISIKDVLSDFKHDSVAQTATRDFNKALDESNIIVHLYNCNNMDFDWCFIHQKVNDIDLNPKQTQFAFVPLNTMEVPLFKPPESLNIEQLDQWAFKAH